jgi:hypothetical protein
VPAYKRQHFVPASYLRYFAIDQSKCDRRSRLWRTDKNGSIQVSAKTQCAENFIYSRDDAAVAEAHFQIFEKSYCDCLDCLRQDWDLSRQQYGNLLLCMWNLNLRNAAHQNLSDHDGFRAYQIRWHLAATGLLLGGEGILFDTASFQAHIENFWSLRIMVAPRDSFFITSDNPAMMISLSPVSRLVDGLVLPLTPTLLAFAFDHRRVRFKNTQLSPRDVSNLNGEQIINSISAVYSAQPLSPDSLNAVRGHFSKAVPHTKTKFTNEHWIAPVREWPPDSDFSFLSAVPPVL